MTQNVADWVVTTSAERVVLDEQRRARATFSVQNMQPVGQDVTVVVVTDDTARSWFTVTDQTRHLDAGAVAPFVVDVTVPADAPAGEYAFQAKAYTTGEAAEERPTLSNRILLEIPAGAPPRPKFKLWWLAVPVALVVIAATVVTIVVTTRADPAPVPTATSELATVPVPDLAGLAEADALAALDRAGLTPIVKHRHDPANAGTVTQSIPAGTEVARGASIDVVFSVALSAPENLLPANNTAIPAVPQTTAMATFPFNVSTPIDIELSWTQREPYVTTWLLAISHQICFTSIFESSRSAVYGAVETVTEPSFSSTRYFRLGTGRGGLFSGGELYSCGDEIWQVGPVDDFGNLGPTASSSYGLQR